MESYFGLHATLACSGQEDGTISMLLRALLQVVHLFLTCNRGDSKLSNGPESGMTECFAVT